MAVHFIGFTGSEYHSALKIWGQPDFIHRWYDRRAVDEIVAGDVAIFANDSERKVVPYVFDDSDIY
jgi:hypothetical protein